MRLIDLTGKRIGLWTVIKHVGQDANGNTQWLCRCACGKRRKVDGYSLRHGTSKSCGCRRTAMQITHGHTCGKRSPEFLVWAGLFQRCYNPKASGYKYYGARGIRVCRRWTGPNGFVNFLADMGHRPPGKSLDRIRVNGHYTPSNCRWATAHEQVKNRRAK